MATGVDLLLRDLAREPRSRADRLAAELTEVSRSELPDVWEYEDLVAQEPATTTGHITAVLDVLEHGLDLTQVGRRPRPSRLLADSPPTDCRSAICCASTGSATPPCCTSSMNRYCVSPRAPNLVHETMNTLTRLGFAYVDRTSEQAVTAHQEERDRWP
jgi:hypothetical protein